MAGFIEVSEGQDWTSANWVYHAIMDGVLEDVARFGNEALRNEVEQSKWMQTFSLTEMPVDEWKSLLIESMNRVCDSVESGNLAAKVDGKTLDDLSQIEFRNDVRKLSEKLRSVHI